jgi:hypothetical protein
MTNQERMNQMVELFKIASPDFERLMPETLAILTHEEFKQLAFVLTGELKLAVIRAKNEAKENKAARLLAKAA